MKYKYNFEVQIEDENVLVTYTSGSVILTLNCTLKQLKKVYNCTPQILSPFLLFKIKKENLLPITEEFKSTISVYSWVNKQGSLSFRQEEGQIIITNIQTKEEFYITEKELTQDKFKFTLKNLNQIKKQQEKKAQERSTLLYQQLKSRMGEL